MSGPAIVIAPLVACFSLGAWLIAHRRQRLTTDTATSNIASAVQGYVELVGRAAVHPSAPIISRIHALPCAWYHYLVQEKDNDTWKTIQEETSDSTFLLRDDTGECIIDPDHAEILTRNPEVKQTGNHRFIEYLVLPNDPLYALGEFRTINPVEIRLNVREEIGETLAEWKKNRPQLLARFDLNGDGEIDEREWQLARAQAKRDVEKHHRDMRARPGFHVLRAPENDRRFLITNRDP